MTKPMNIYPRTVDLPFNSTCLNKNYQPATPDQDPGGEGCWLILQGMHLLTITGANGETLPTGDLPLPFTSLPQLYIGLWKNRPCRLITVDESIELPLNWHPQHLRSSKPEVDIALLSLAGCGNMIRHWEDNSRYCGICNGTMKRLHNEWGKRCQNCNSHHFPRIHPCVIGLIIKGDEILLARKAEWVDGRYGLVAGFVEFGESLEEAMARETLEETGIKIKNIRYIGSQSWPFPSQLMCGFVADYDGGEIELRDQELADAKWYKLDQLPTLPPNRSIARYLIDRAANFMG